MRRALAGELPGRCSECTDTSLANWLARQCARTETRAVRFLLAAQLLGEVFVVSILVPRVDGGIDAVGASRCAQIDRRDANAFSVRRAFLLVVLGAHDTASVAASASGEGQLHDREPSGERSPVHASCQSM
jgi:hypothetical protein